MKKSVLVYLILTKEIVFCSYFNTFICPCPLRGNVYSTVTLPSKGFCAYLCNAVESCDWILWNGDSKICMLHSFKQSGVYIDTTINGFKWIGKKPSSSSKPKYKLFYIDILHEILSYIFLVMNVSLYQSTV